TAHANAQFCFQTTPTTQTYTLSLHDALPISRLSQRWRRLWRRREYRGPHRQGLPARSGPGVGSGIPRVASRRLRVHSRGRHAVRSEEHTSELQSLAYLVCRLLLEKKTSRTIHGANELFILSFIRILMLKSALARTRLFHE